MMMVYGTAPPKIVGTSPSKYVREEKLKKFMSKHN
jgi:hypothetical protein